MPRRSTRVPKPDASEIDVPVPVNQVDLEAPAETLTIVDIYDDDDDMDGVDYGELPEDDEENVTYDGPEVPEVLPERFTEPKERGVLSRLLTGFGLGVLRFLKSALTIAVLTTFAFFAYTVYKSGWDWDYAWEVVKEFYIGVWWLVTRLAGYWLGL